MKRFFAVVGIVAFLAACSDSNMTTPTTHLRPGAAARDAGDPPPPPLSGSGSGDLSLGGDASIQGSSLPSCSGPTFFLSYTFSYLGNNPSNNQVVNANLNGTQVTGGFDLHQNENGKSNAHGHITNGSFAFDIQGGDGTINAFVDNLGNVSGSFHFTVNGILTDLTTGAKCQVSDGHLDGSLAPST
jgi:hypothetical protein